MQFTAAAHTHDLQPIHMHSEASAAQHNNHHAHISGSYKLGVDEDEDCHQDEGDYPEQPHYCSVCIIASQNDEIDLETLLDSDKSEGRAYFDAMSFQYLASIPLHFQLLARDEPEISSVKTRFKPQRAPPAFLQ